MIDCITNENIREYASDIANSKSRGSRINRNEFVSTISQMELLEVGDYDIEKITFLTTSLEKDDSIVKKILAVTNETLEQNNRIRHYERNIDAIKILEKYSDIDECILCDSAISAEDKFREKMQMNTEIKSELNEGTRKILEDLLSIVNGNDPFNLKNRIVDAIDSGDYYVIEELKCDIIDSLELISNLIINEFIYSLGDTQIQENSLEYDRLVGNRPELTEEDVIYIETVINENIEKKIELVRDDNNTLRLVLDGHEFLNRERKELRLSNGEQNFISIAFELLKARNSEKEIIVLDDPISSFDSIFKNKIAFSIVKFLEEKKQIILTHNTELVRLLEHQKKNCYNLYLFNNTIGEANGFFALNDSEKELILYINKLVQFLKGDVGAEISNQLHFLVSLVPFMRGFSQLICDVQTRNKLTSLMHGYNNEKQDITKIFKDLFGESMVFERSITIGADDIVNMDIEDIAIFNEGTEYKLLEKTLKHSLTYLYLRLRVEKTLVEKFNVNTSRYEMLSQIIFRAFSGDDLDSRKKRVFLASRKTLLNDFNHFEGNMNIFQPAIDITDSALEKEKDSILDFLNVL